MKRIINKINYNQFNIIYATIIGILFYQKSSWIYNHISQPLVQELSGFLVMLAILIITFPAALIFRNLWIGVAIFGSILCNTLYFKNGTAMLLYLEAHPGICSFWFGLFILWLLWKKLPEGMPNPIPVRHPAVFLQGLLEKIARNNVQIITAVAVSAALYFFLKSNPALLATVAVWFAVATLLVMMWNMSHQFFGIVIGGYLLILLPYQLGDHTGHLLKALTDILQIVP